MVFLYQFMQGKIQLFGSESLHINFQGTGGNLTIAKDASSKSLTGNFVFSIGDHVDVLFSGALPT